MRLSTGPQAPTTPKTPKGNAKDARLYIPGELPRQKILLGPQLVVFASPNNPGAREAADALNNGMGGAFKVVTNAAALSNARADGEHGSLLRGCGFLRGRVSSRTTGAKAAAAGAPTVLPAEELDDGFGWVVGCLGPSAPQQRQLVAPAMLQVALSRVRAAVAPQLPKFEALSWESDVLPVLIVAPGLPQLERVIARPFPFLKRLANGDATAAASTSYASAAAARELEEETTMARGPACHDVATHFLLYLNDKTYEGDAGMKLVKELMAARDPDSNVKVLLACLLYHTRSTEHVARTDILDPTLTPTRTLTPTLTRC